MKKSDFCKITNLLSYKRCLISYLIFSVFISVSYSAYSVVPSIELPYLIEKSKADLIAQQNTQDIKRINIRLQKYIAVDDTASALAIADSIRFFLGHGIRK